MSKSVKLAARATSGSVEVKSKVSTGRWVILITENIRQLPTKIDNLPTATDSDKYYLQTDNRQEILYHTDEIPTGTTKYRQIPTTRQMSVTLLVEF